MNLSGVVQGDMQVAIPSPIKFRIERIYSTARPEGYRVLNPEVELMAGDTLTVSTDEGEVTAKIEIERP